MKKYLYITSLLLFGCSSQKSITIVTLPTGTTASGVFKIDQKPNIVSNDFNITEANVIDDTLKVNVQYSGGCNRHDFYAYIKEQKKDTITINLLHNNNGDVCRALKEETIWFDLISLKSKTTKFIKIEQFPLMRY